MDLSILVEDRDRWVLIKLAGVVDVFAAARLEEKLLEVLAAEAEHVIVDLNEVRLLDSSALGVLLGSLKELRSRGGGLRVVCSSGKVTRLFQVTGLAQIFPMFDSVEQALALPPQQPGAESDEGSETPKEQQI